MVGSRGFEMGSFSSCLAPIVEVVSMPRPVVFSIIRLGHEPMVCLSREHIDRSANRRLPMPNPFRYLMLRRGRQGKRRLIATWWSWPVLERERLPC